ncbi:MAG: hypothetical protein VZR02_02355 [Lachnospiraceae bacterium]|nr:hypothetical protein [Lachnospiraceae bacterium]
MAVSWKNLTKAIKKDKVEAGNPETEENAASTVSEDEREGMRRLTRAQLLELLVMESQEREQLEKELTEARAELKDRKIRIDKAGSLAEAALSVNKVYEKAQETADQYLENIRAMKEETETECAKRKEETEEACRKMKEETEAACEKRKEEAEASCKTMREETEAECAKRKEEAAAEAAKLKEKAEAECVKMKGEAHRKSDKAASQSNTKKNRKR